MPKISTEKNEWSKFKYDKSVYRIRKGENQDLPHVWNRYEIEVWVARYGWDEVKHPTAICRLLAVWIDQNSDQELIGKWRYASYRADGRASKKEKFRFRLNKNTDSEFWLDSIDVETKTNFWGWSRNYDQVKKKTLLESLKLTSNNFVEKLSQAAW